MVRNSFFYLQTIEGHSDWSVVVSAPNQVILALAVQMRYRRWLFRF